MKYYIKRIRWKKHHVMNEDIQYQNCFCRETENSRRHAKVLPVSGSFSLVFKTKRNLSYSMPIIRPYFVL